MMLLAKSFLKYRVHQLPSVLSLFKPCNQEKLFSNSIKGKDLYSILGVSPNATQTEIKDSYYKLTLKFHPDRNEGSPEAAVRFHDITEAYEILGNYFLRKRYDKGMPLPTRHEPPTEPGVPHVVKYQKFFDARNLPYQPSAYAAGGGARKFDEYHAKQFSERQTRAVIDEDREYREMCASRKTPTMIGLILFLLVIKHLVKPYLDMATGPRVEVEHFEQYPFKWEYAEPIPPRL